MPSMNPAACSPPAEMRWTMFRLAMFGAAITSTLLAGGCGQRAKEPALREVDLPRLAGLPGLRASADPRLQQELARLDEEGATPLALTPSAVPDEQNGWKLLEPLLLPDFRATAADDSQQLFARLFARRTFAFPVEALDEAIAYRAKHDDRLEALRQALDRPEFDLGIDPARGPFADISALDLVRHLARLEAFQGAEFLDYGELDEAIASLENLWRLASRVGRQPRLAARLAAASIRDDAIYLLENIVHDSRTTRAQLEQIYQKLLAVLAQWPSDAAALVADRAQGLYVYELVRAGHVDHLLTDAERERLAEAHLLEALLVDSPALADDDELFYLTTMRSLLAKLAVSYDKLDEASFAARKQAIDHLRAELHRRQSDPHAVVATWLLLPEVSQAADRLAEERAAYEAWALALARALGHEPPQGLARINPVSGTPYHVSREPDYALVWRPGGGIGGARQPVRVPLPKATASESRP